MLKHKIWAEIDTYAIEHNYRAVSEFVKKSSSDCSVMCIVKADCYGHGTELCIPKLNEIGVRDFGVSCIEEALEVRKYSKDSRILILGYTPVENAATLIKENITQSVYSYEYAKQLSDAAASFAERGEIGEDESILCHVKIDTGMNRIGFSSTDPDCVDDIARASKLPHLSFVGAFTHFACADETKGEGKDMSREQYGNFDRIVKELKGQGVEFECLHCCNSAAAIRYPEYRMNMVRLGIMLYGYSPFEEGEYPIGLLPVMRFVTTVAHVHTLKAGESVSYGATFRAERDMKIATVAAGYADGFLRAFGDGGMYVKGQYAPIVGRVCMDQCMLDVSGIDGVCVGDEAEIFDREGKNANSLSRIAKTISYELLCSVSKRVARIPVSSER